MDIFCYKIFVYILLLGIDSFEYGLLLFNKLKVGICVVFIVKGFIYDEKNLDMLVNFIVMVK